MERLAGIRVAYTIETGQATIAVVESVSAERILAKAVRVPVPSIIIGENNLAPAGVAIPDRRGKVPGEPFGLVAGTKLRVIEWQDVFNGGGSKVNRRWLEDNDIVSTLMPFKYNPKDYYNLLKGRGVLNGHPKR